MSRFAGTLMCEPVSAFLGGGMRFLEWIFGNHDGILASLDLVALDQAVCRIMSGMEAVEW